MYFLNVKYKKNNKKVNVNSNIQKICGECWISGCNKIIKDNSFIFSCPFCRNNIAN